MKRMLALALMGLVGLMAGNAIAQADGQPNTISFFWDEAGTQTNLDIDYRAFFGYVVLMNPTVDGICGVEFGLRIPANVTVLGVDWFGGSMGTGNNFDVQCVWPLATVGPLPVGQVTVVAVYSLGAAGDPTGDVEMGPFSIPSVPGVPMILGPDQFQLNDCTLPIAQNDIGPDGFGVVATINGEGVVATENRVFSAVKGLFR